MKITILNILFILFFACNVDTSSKLIKEMNRYKKINEILIENYDAFRKLDTIKYHNNVSLNLKKFELKCNFINEDDFNLVIKSFKENHFENIAIYDSTDILFTISSNSNFFNSKIEYLLYSNNIEVFMNKKCSFVSEIETRRSLDGNWFYLVRKTSLAI